MDETEGFLDELFKVCLKELKNVEEDYYKPFSDFARVLYYTTDMNNYIPNLMYQYLEKYNAKLRENSKTIFSQYSAVPIIEKFSTAVKCI